MLMTQMFYNYKSKKALILFSLKVNNDIQSPI